MNKLSQGLAAVAILGGIVVGGILLPENSKIPEHAIDNSPVPMNPENARIAIADIDCLRGEGIEIDDVKAVCDQWWKRGPYLECVTDRQQIHKCEVDRNDLPDSAFRRFYVCRYQQDGQWQSAVGFAKLDEQAPVGWTCVVIAPKVLRWRSQPNIRDELTQALEEKCGWPVQPDSWGCCPGCLIWPEGCPPCRSIGDKYGRGWQGHEAECE